MTSTASFAGFESTFTRMVRAEFISHAPIPLLPREKAEAVLIGHIHAIRTEPLSYRVEKFTVEGQTATHETTRSRWLQVKLDARLMDARTGRVIWEGRGLEDKAAFQVSTDPLKTRQSRLKALETLAERLAERIYLQAVERF